MTKKAIRFASVFAALLLALGLMLGLAGCGGRDKPADDGPADPGETVDPGTEDEGHGAVLYDISAYTNDKTMGALSFVFYEDGKVYAASSAYTAVNAYCDWEWYDDTTLTFWWGEGDPDWYVEFVTRGGETIAYNIRSESMISVLRGPFVGFPEGIVATLESTTRVTAAGMTEDSVLVIYEDGTSNFLFGSMSFACPWEFADGGAAFTITTNFGPFTGTAVYDDAGYLSGLEFDEFIDGPHSFVKIGLAGDTGSGSEGGTTVTGTSTISVFENANCSIATYDFSLADMSTLNETSTTVTVGNYVAVKVTPDSGYEVAVVLINGVSATNYYGYYCILAETADTNYNVAVTLIEEGGAVSDTVGRMIVLDCEGATVETYDFVLGDYSTLNDPTDVITDGSHVSVKVTLEDGYTLESVTVNGEGTTYMNGYWCYMQHAVAGAEYIIEVTVSK